MKILIVEDNPVNRKLFDDVLSGEGHSVTACERAVEALVILKEDEKPDLILLDLVLPDMTGVELTAKIRENKSTSHIPVIALTGYPEKFMNRIVVNAGFDAYLLKPANNKVLTTLVEGVFAAKKKEESISE